MPIRSLKHIGAMKMVLESVGRCQYYIRLEIATCRFYRELLIMSTLVNPGELC